MILGLLEFFVARAWIYMLLLLMCSNIYRKIKTITNVGPIDKRHSQTDNLPECLFFPLEYSEEGFLWLSHLK